MKCFCLNRPIVGLSKPERTSTSCGLDFRMNRRVRWMVQRFYCKKYLNGLCLNKYLLILFLHHSNLPFFWTKLLLDGFISTNDCVQCIFSLPLSPGNKKIQKERRFLHLFVYLLRHHAHMTFKRLICLFGSTSRLWFSWIIAYQLTSKRSIILWMFDCLLA